jgi:hypothetical protein
MLRQQNVLEEDKTLAMLDKMLPENIQSDTFR